MYSWQNKKKRKLGAPQWVILAYKRYSSGKQTLKELSEQFGKTPWTLRKYFDSFSSNTRGMHIPSRSLCVNLDATFFGRSYGILVARSEGKNLLWKEIDGEKLQYYREILRDLEREGCSFSSFIIDGRRGVRHLLEHMYPDVPIQLCQFHQIQTVTRHLSRKPRLDAGKELRTLSLSITKTKKNEFSQNLEQWHVKWGDFLKEKTVNPETQKWHFTHKRIRSAFFSLKKNFSWLFTCQDFPELNIPNTTNSCDGSFAHWKAKVKLHRGLSKTRRKKMIDFLLHIS